MDWRWLQSSYESLSTCHQAFSACGYGVSMPFLISVIWFTMTSIIPSPSRLLKKLLTIFTSTAASSLMLVYEKILIFQDNTRSATMFILFVSTSPWMAYAPPSLGTNTSKGWRNHGNNQTSGRPCTKCLLQISTWTNWQHCALSSSPVACWKALACLMSYTNYVCQLIMFVEST